MKACSQTLSDGRPNCLDRRAKRKHWCEPHYAQAARAHARHRRNKAARLARRITRSHR